MRVDLFFQAGEPAALDMAERTVVVIDVLRGTSTMVEALVNGARGVYPASSTEDTLLCGESKGLMIEGFDLGNSPREFVAERVADKRLVMSTTNATRAFLMAEDADRVLACCFLNLGAAVDAVAAVERLVVVCAGREGRFSVDDAVCAGALLNSLRERHDGEIELNDAGYAALELSHRFRVGADFLAMTDAGKNLIEIGFRDDLRFCAQVDRYAVVPEMEERVIYVPSMSPRAPEASR